MSARDGVAGTKIGGERARTRRRLWVDLLHVFVLVSFAVAQPLFDLLGRNAEFFVAHRAGTSDVVVFAVVVLVGAALPFALIEALIEWLRPSLRNGVHVVIVAALAALAVEPVLERLGSGTVPLILGAITIGAGVAWFYKNARAARTFVSFLTPAPLAFLFLFLIVSPASHVVLASQSGGAAADQVTRPAPIVMIVFDEFASGVLLNAEHEIDARRFPNLAKLAARSTWYRNATTVSDSTFAAVPAILDGKRPFNRALATVGDHPDNLFTLLSKTYEMNVHERVTQLCPPSVCDPEAAQPFADRIGQLLKDTGIVYEHIVAPPHLAENLPQISSSWGYFGLDGPNAGLARLNDLGESFRNNQAGRLESFIDSIHAADEPTLNFLHVLIPHIPLNRVPSGRAYPNAYYVPGLFLGDGFDFWIEDPYLGNLGLQRYLLQAEYVDRAIGRLVKRLKSEGVYDDSLIVLTADHGVSFIQNEERRTLDDENAGQLLPVPLILKKPHQTRGRVSDQNVETIDVLPTIADVIGANLPFDVDGISVIHKDAATRPTKVAIQGKGLERFERSAEFPERYQLTQRVIDVFQDCCGRYVTYAFGPNAAIVGKKLVELDVAKDATAYDAEFDPAYDFHSTKSAVTAYVTGVINQPVGSVPVPLAVAVNGAVGGVGQTFVPDDGKTHFAMMAAEWLFEAGDNRVELFTAWPGKDGKPNLVRIPVRRGQPQPGSSP